MEFIKLKIKGMTCDHCAQSISKLFHHKEGIIKNDISYLNEVGDFEFDSKKISKEDIINTINSTGHYKVVREVLQPKKIDMVQFAITGMSCDHCAQSIDKLFQGVPGILSREISYHEADSKFTYEMHKISKSEIKKIINNTGHYKVTDEILQRENKKENIYDLIIIGGGSAAFSAAIKAESLGLTTLMINGGLDFGGTCVNVGCVPSKNIIRAAETVYHSNHSNFSGIRPNGANIDFKQLIKDKKKLVATLQEKKYMDVVSDFKHLTMLKGWASFIDKKTIQVEGKEYKAIKFLIATGATTNIPKINGLSTINYLTNISLFDLEEQPKSMIVLGGGYIALEIAQAYQRLGTKVTLLQRSAQVLSKQSADIANELTKHLQNEGLEILTDLKFIELTENRNKVMVTVEHKGVQKIVEAQKILVATGTKPNTNKLGLENINLDLDEKGHILTNDMMETNLPNIFAAGDCIQTPSYVYTAAFEGKTAIENAFTGSNIKSDYSSLPWVVFTDPQVAGAGIDEQEAEKLHIPYEVSKLELDNVPRSIAANDTRGFIKLIRNSDTDKLIGARVVAPEGGELIQQLSMAIKFGITIKELAESFYPYLTLGEGIKLAAITFGKDVSKLSCCAT